MSIGVGGGMCTGYGRFVLVGWIILVVAWCRGSFILGWSWRGPGFNLDFK